MNNENDNLYAFLTQEFSKVHCRLDQVDTRLNQIDTRLDKLENKVDVLTVKQNKTTEKLQALQLQVNLSEYNVRNDIHLLQDAAETMEQILRFNNLFPLKHPQPI